MVQRFVSHQTGVYGPCYASYINDSLAIKPNDVMDKLDESEVNILVDSLNILHCCIR